MNNSNRRLLIAIAVIVVVACVCIAVMIVGGGITWLATSQIISNELVPTIVSEAVTLEILPSATTVSTTPTTTLEALEKPTDSANDAASPTSTAAQQIPAETLNQMLGIESDVSQIRQLQGDNENFTRVLLSPQELEERVKSDFLNDYTEEDIRRDLLVLSSFGLLEPNFDLVGLYEQLLSEQVAGFYDDDTKEMVVVQGQEFGGSEKATYAHEYTHTLQDENYDLKNGLKFDDEPCEADTERCAAVQALLEGDATLAEEIWLIEYSTNQDKLDILEFYDSYSSPVYDSAPEFLQEDFLFPYLQGRSFVQYFVDQFGWDRITGLYQNPPVSTEQILHPEKYPDDKPIPVPLPDLVNSLSGEWIEIDRNVLGEWYTYLLLSRGLSPNAQLNDQTGASAAEGWGGDTYLVLLNASTNDEILVHSAVWDSPEDGLEFASAFIDYADLRYLSTHNQVDENLWEWNTADAHVSFQVDLNSGSTLWIVAPDEQITRQIRAALTEQK